MSNWSPHTRSHTARKETYQERNQQRTNTKRAVKDGVQQHILAFQLEVQVCFFLLLYSLKLNTSLHSELFTTLFQSVTQFSLELYHSFLEKKNPNHCVESTDAAGTFTVLKDYRLRCYISRCCFSAVPLYHSICYFFKCHQLVSSWAGVKLCSSSIPMFSEATGCLWKVLFQDYFFFQRI